MSSVDWESVERKLNIILRLLVQSSLPGGSQKDKIALLHSLGLTANEMAEIVGTTPSTVRKTISRLLVQSKGTLK